MNHKWNIIMMNTMIGRKKIFLQLLLISLITNSCIFEHFEDPPDDYNYRIYYKNATNDTLILLLGSDSAAYETETFKLYPLDSVRHNGIPINKGEDVIKDGLFSGYYLLEDQARVYKEDSLVVNWYGPPREMHDSIHHFFNYNSWDHWLINRHKGRVRFTIYEEDVQ